MHPSVISLSFLNCDGEDVCAGQDWGREEVTWLSEASLLSSWDSESVVESSFLVFHSPEKKSHSFTIFSILLVQKSKMTDKQRFMGNL